MHERMSAPSPVTRPRRPHPSPHPSPLSPTLTARGFPPTVAQGLREIFSKAKPKEKVKGGGSKKKKKKAAEAFLISNQRATNMGIMLSKFANYKTHEDIGLAVLTLDKGLTEERLEALITMVPTALEAPKLKSYEGRTSARSLPTRSPAHHIIPPGQPFEHADPALGLPP